MATLLGLDYGKRRVGVAVSNDDATLAFAVGTHVAGRDGSILTWLGALITERQVTGIVLGLPLRADGCEGDMARAVRDFAARLQETFDLPIHFQDERYTSSEATGYLRTARKKRKEDIDALAAEIILQCYLDRQRAGSGPDKGSTDEDPR